MNLMRVHVPEELSFYSSTMLTVLAKAILSESCDAPTFRLIHFIRLQVDYKNV